MIQVAQVLWYCPLSFLEVILALWHASFLVAPSEQKCWMHSCLLCHRPDKLNIIKRAKNILKSFQTYLHDHISNDDPERIGNNNEEQPDLHRFDVWGVWQRHGDGHVDGGQHHHACHVHRDDQLIQRESPLMLLVAWFMMFVRRTRRECMSSL